MTATVPKVSVSILTYNQEAFIAQAIESVLMQQTDFPVEIRIGDDCSDDGTRAILEAYRSRHPDRIFLNLQPRRPDGIVGRVNNMTNLASCRGRYIAMLDGDDYWTDPRKLQRQVDLLDADPTLGGVAHDAAVLADDTAAEAKPRFSQMVSFNDPFKEIVTLEDVILSPPFQASTFVFRGEAIRPFPDWFATIPAGDWGIFALVAALGPIRVFNETLSVYRRHGGSIVADLLRAKRIERNRWHQTSMMAVARAFPTARRGRQWTLVALRLRIARAFDEGRTAAAIALSLRLALYDPDFALQAVRHPGRYLRRIASGLAGRALDL